MSIRRSFVVVGLVASTLCVVVGAVERSDAAPPTNGSKTTPNKPPVASPGPSIAPGTKIGPPGPQVNSRIPPAAQRALSTLLPNTSAFGGIKPSPNARLHRTFRGADKCEINRECILYGHGLGQRGAAPAPAGVRIDLQFTPTKVLPSALKLKAETPIRVVPTAWSDSLIAFMVPPDSAPGKYTITIRDESGNDMTNALPVGLVNHVDGDADGDGSRSISSGGNDCDDLDPRAHPGNAEIADNEDSDEDCNPQTFGVRDLDGDGVASANFCNIEITGSGRDRSFVWRCGSDCDDSRVAILPGEMICDPRDASVIFQCVGNGGSWLVDPRTTPGRGMWEPWKCAGWGPQGVCTAQPNGRGACQ